ncbi:MAG: hypothetical protein NVSMB52_01820 [Chloroflexota bacterium]
MTMNHVLQTLTTALAQLGLSYSVRHDLQAIQLGIQLDSGRRVSVVLHANEEAEDVTISATVSSVSARARTRVARLLAEQANARFNGVTFSLVDEAVIVDHLVDLEFAMDAEALIRKGLYRIVCAVDELQDQISTAAGRRKQCSTGVLLQAEQVLDDLHFA